MAERAHQGLWGKCHSALWSHDIHPLAAGHRDKVPLCSLHVHWDVLQLTLHVSPVWIQDPTTSRFPLRHFLFFPPPFKTNRAEVLHGDVFACYLLACLVLPSSSSNSWSLNTSWLEATTTWTPSNICLGCWHPKCMEHPCLCFRTSLAFLNFSAYVGGRWEDSWDYRTRGSLPHQHSRTLRSSWA